MTSAESLLQARLPLFPITTEVRAGPKGPELCVGGQSLAALADRFDTPLYVYDQATMDAAVAAYWTALERYYPGEAAITFAGKALLFTAMAQWVQRRGLWLDCTGAGELAIAAAAGSARSRILVHGVNKSRADLDAAVRQAGVIVVDNLTELKRLAELLTSQPLAVRPALWLRLRPGLAVATHSYRQTGQEDSKFGMGVEEALEAVALCQQQGLALTGLHFHQGSHFRDPSPIGPALATVLDLMVTIRAASGWSPEVLCPGGGWGVAYHEAELPHPPTEEYVAFIARHLVEGCEARGLPLPRLQLEPGRSLVALAGVAIYRVGTVKASASRRWLLIDGGLADNPRRALYGAAYSALPVWEPDRPAAPGPLRTAWVAGPFCESGDVLIDGLALPEITAGEVIAVPVSGAYQLTMGSNYNGARKPAVLWLRAGQATLVQRRETITDLTARDYSLPQD